ncbi:polysaccharide biosynthesis tyrosine autokinase [Microbacterium sp. zg.Y909]|uniref:polysaccharide biosynthesis tyrosine autokinase n=1 Tax=Microbacterium sp. zg.Y909 TaxID=2969413 RepID=UPI00214C6811|nr:polysaccharide biosynthesis tyrosine autokinase [Microbacterium sp. zg.Y909]MCR2823970.1 polysaccharide biosynthesis tyrosine autokinase [Microbacterium sp. zg.Y909]
MESSRILRIIRFNWMNIILCIMLGAAGGAAVAWATPPEYTARADVFVAVTGSSTTGDLAQGSNFSQQQARNFSAVATREVVLAPVIEQLGLDMTTAELRSQVSTSVALNTSMISIQVTDPAPRQAARVANLVAQNLASVVPTLSPQVDGASPVRLRVIETATPPSTPSAPNTAMLVIMGALAGVVLAALVITLRVLVGTRVRTAEQAREAVGAEVIGSIVYDRAAARRPLAILNDPQSLRAEDYRRLRANLRFLQAAEPHRAFVFTSSQPGEGKSSTAANVAVALGAAKLSVCLVEGDLRRPSLGRVLDLPPDVGFTDVITGEVDLDDALQSYGPDGVHVLLAGDVPPNPAELLESAAAVEILERLRAAHDVIIIDSPPLNAVADAAVLARLCGGVVFVVGARRVRAREVRRAVSRLHAVGADVDGVVLNMTTASHADRRGYSAYTTGGPAPVHGERAPSRGSTSAAAIDDVDIDLEATSTPTPRESRASRRPPAEEATASRR